MDWDKVTHCFASVAIDTNRHPVVQVSWFILEWAQHSFWFLQSKDETRHCQNRVGLKPLRMLQVFPECRQSLGVAVAPCINIPRVVWTTQESQNITQNISWVSDDPFSKSNRPADTSAPRISWGRKSTCFMSFSVRPCESSHTSTSSIQVWGIWFIWRWNPYSLCICHICFILSFQPGFHFQVDPQEPSVRNIVDKQPWKVREYPQLRISYGSGRSFPGLGHSVLGSQTVFFKPSCL